MRKNIADYLFSPAVRATHKSLGSSALISKLESKGHWTAELSSNQLSLISDMESFYFGTASKDGEPYIQYRGGTWYSAGIARYVVRQAWNHTLLCDAPNTSGM